MHDITHSIPAQDVRDERWKQGRANITVVMYLYSTAPLSFEPPCDNDHASYAFFFEVFAYCVEIFAHAFIRINASARARDDLYHIGRFFVPDGTDTAMRIHKNYNSIKMVL